MFRTWWQKFFSFPRTRSARRRGMVPPARLRFRTTRLSMTALEDRITPATFVDNGTTLNLVLNIANTNAAIVSNGTSYSVTLTGDTWTGTNDANVTGNGTATLTVTVAGIAAFTNQISLTDAAAAGDSAAFNNSGANLYVNNFNINLSDPAAGGITFNGTSSFGANSLFASTTNSIAVNAVTGGAVSLISTTGSVSSSGAQAVQATGTLTVDAATGITLNTSANGLSADNTTSGNISITQLASPTQSLTITGGGVVNDAATGTIDITNLGAGITVNGGSPVQSTNGDITLAATDLQINGTIDSGTARTVLTNSTAGQTFDLGTDTPGSIGLTNAELANISAGVLQIGGANAGAINVSAAITAPAGWTTLSLINNGTITETAGGSLTVGNLRVSSTGPVMLGSVNNVGNLAASTSGSFFIDNGTNTLTIPNAGVDGVSGVTTTNSNITISADGMAIQAPIDAGTGIATLQQAGTTARNIDLGLGTTAGDLGLGDADLALVTAGVLRIGRSDNAGNILITAPVAVEPGFSTLSLISGGSITDSATTETISVTDLAARAAAGISLDTAVSHLAVRNTASGNVRVANAGEVFLIAVDTLDGSAGNTLGNFAAGGTTTFTNTFNVDNGFIYATNYTSSGTITTTVEEAPVPGPGDSIIVNPSVTVQSTAGDVVFLAGDDIAENSAALVQAANGNVDFRTGFGDNDGSGTMTIDGTVSANAATGTVALNVNATNVGLPSGVAIVLEGTSGSITAAGLLLLNLPVDAAGGFQLFASPSNAIGTIAADTNALINFRDGTPLTVGTVTSSGEGLTGVGILSNNQNVTLQAAGTITVDQAVNAGTAAATLNSTGGNITNTLAGTDVAGGAITLTAAGSGGINLGVDTTTPATAGVTATTTNAPIVLTSTSQLQVDNINAGPAGDVTLTVTNPNTATSSITSLHPNDNVADVTGRTVTLTANGSSTGNTGQIGFFTSSAQFFEVAATTLNASTNNSRLWISAIGGAAIGSVNAGTNTAFLRTFNGTLTSTNTGTTPDVTAAAVNLSQSPAATSGAFGTAANPLLTLTSTLTAKVAAGPGSINVANVPAGGNLAVAAASTVSGPINLAVVGGNLTTTAAAGTAISAPSSTVTLTVSGAVVSGTPVGVTDVAAGNLAITAGAGIGSGANPLKTVVTNLAFNNAGGSVTVANTGPLTINAVGSLLTSANNGTTTTLSAASPVTFAVNTTSAGTFTATAVETNDPGVFADKLTVNPGITVESTGGNVILQAGDDVVLDTGALVKSDGGSVTLTAAFNDMDNEGGISMVGGTVQAGTDITLTALDKIALGTLTAGPGVGTVTIDSQGGATEATGGAITGLNLLLLGAGTFTLTQPGNNFAVIAANVNGTIAYTDSSALTIGTVNGTVGITATGLTLRVTNALLLNQPINVGAGTVILQSTAAGIIDGNGAANNVVAGNLAMEAAAGIGAGDAIETQGPGATPGNLNLAFENTGGATAVANTGPLTIVGVSSIDGTSAQNGSANTGTTTTLSAASPVTFAVDTTSAGDLTATAIETNDPGVFADKLTVNPGITVESTGGNVTLQAGDDIVLDAGSLVKSDTGAVTLTAAFNDMDNEGAIAAGPGTVQAATKATFTALGDIVLGVVTVTAGDITASTSQGAIQLQQALNASGIVRLQAVTGISQTATGTVTAAALGARNTTSGDIQLDQANAVPVLAAVNLAPGAGISFHTTSALSLDNVTADGALFAAVAGLTTTGAGGTVRLQAAGLSQTAVGIVASDLLGVRNTTAGNVILDQPNVVNTFAANNAVAGGRVTLRAAGALIIGDVTAQGTFAATSGITTNAGIAYIQAGGNVTQTATGLVNSQALAVGITAGGTIRLDQGNNVATFAASDPVAGGLVNFRTIGGLTLDMVTSGSALLAPIAGVTTNAGTALLRAANGIGQTAAGLVTSATLGLRNDTSGDIQLDQANVVGTLAGINNAAGAGLNFRTTGALSLDTAAGDGTFVTVNGVTTTGTGGTVRLQATGLSQTAVGIVTSDLLGVLNTTAGNVILDQPNAVNTFAANNTVAGGRVTLRAAGALVIGDVTAQGTFPATSGITTNAGIAYVQAGGNVTQTATGLVNSPTFAVGSSAGGSIQLDHGNNVATFAADNTVAGGLINFRTIGALTLDTVTSGSALLAPIAGVTTNGGTALLRAADGISQTAAGLVTSSTLGVLNDTAGSVILDQPNVVDTIAGNNLAAGGRITLQDAGALVIGAVAAQGTFPATSGITTNAGIAFIQAGGNVTQTTAGLVNSEALAVGITAGGTIRLDQANNVATFAANDPVAGGLVNFRTIGGLTLDTVTSGSALLPAIAGLTTNAGTALLHAADGIGQTATGLVTSATLGLRNDTSGNIQLDQANVINTLAGVNNVLGAAIDIRSTVALSLDTAAGDGTFATVNGVTTTGKGGTVRLQTSGLSQTAAGIITADLLGVRNTVTGDVILDQPNVVNAFAADNAVAGGRVTLRAAGALIIGDVTAQGTFAATSGITTTAGIAYVQAGGNVTQTATGLMNSPTFAVGSSAGGTIRLDQGNTVATFAANDTVAGGLVNFRTVGGLTLDTVTSGSALLAPIAGVTTNAGTALLHAAAGIGQTAAGLVTSVTLGVRNDTTGSISLTKANSVGRFAAANGAAGGTADLTVINDLTLTTVAADGTFTAVRGITTNNGNSTLTSGRNFTASDANFGNKAAAFVNLGTGLFQVNPGQTAGATVTFVAEVAATRATFGTVAGSVFNNPFPDSFLIRPSQFTPITVNGNLPTTFPGDSLRLDLLTPTVTDLVFTPLPGQGNGMFTFTHGSRQTLNFTSIEKLPQASLSAAAIQTGPKSFEIEVQGVFGPSTANPFLLVPPSGNPFIVAPAMVNPVQPFGAPRLAVADVNGDGVPDLIIAAGPGSQPLVTVVDGTQLFGPHNSNSTLTGTLMGQFFAYNPNFLGGVFVAAGDLFTYHQPTKSAPLGTNTSGPDGMAEIVTGADAGGGPHVDVFTFTNSGNPNNTFVDIGSKTLAVGGTTLIPAGGFFAYGASFSGGVRVAVGDVNGDGIPDIITGAGPGGGPHVKAFSGVDLSILDSFYAYNANFGGGVYVGAGDYNGDGFSDILTGAGLGGGPHVEVFSGKFLTTGTGPNILNQFMAFGPDGASSLFGPDLGNTSGVGSVAFTDIDGNGTLDIVVGSARGPRTRLAAFLNGQTTPFNFNTLPNFALPFLGFTAVDSNGDLTIPSLADGDNVAGVYTAT